MPGLWGMSSSRNVYTCELSDPHPDALADDVEAFNVEDETVGFANLA